MVITITRQIDEMQAERYATLSENAAEQYAAMPAPPPQQQTYAGR